MSKTRIGRNRFSRKVVAASSRRGKGGAPCHHINVRCTTHLDERSRGGLGPRPSKSGHPWRVLACCSRPSASRRHLSLWKPRIAPCVGNRVSVKAARHGPDWSCTSADKVSHLDTARTCASLIGRQCQQLVRNHRSLSVGSSCECWPWQPEPCDLNHFPSRRQVRRRPSCADDHHGT